MSMEGKMIKPSDAMDVYTRLKYAAENGLKDLGIQERERLENLLIDSYAEQVTRWSDEGLLEEAVERGIL